MPLLYSRAQICEAVTKGLTLAADEARLSSSAARFTWARTAAVTLLERPGAAWAEVKSEHNKAAPSEPPTDDNTPRFTRDQVSQAVNNGVDLAAEHNGRANPDDLDNFVINAALSLLDDPDADFDQVVAECYGERPSVVRSWL
ncbi:hypothetical protein OG478_13630 [Streptomyces phaeochromogenes]|uniref:hypothetical protein n=1 Tax=Streptomyces phaeochromogenes TaxID=1923 RepID=UPI003867561A|nr:hypothetical protein OG478_13630 [Streptomyces phaeochromogenes]